MEQKIEFVKQPRKEGNSWVITIPKDFIKYGLVSPVDIYIVRLEKIDRRKM